MQRIPLVELMHFIFGPHRTPLQGSENSYKFSEKCRLNIGVSHIKIDLIVKLFLPIIYSRCTIS